MAKLKNNAFTIIEMLVAMGLLVMLAGLSSAVFSLTVKSHRRATASIDVARGLRTLSDQLTADLSGLRTDAPLMIWFGIDSNDDDENGDVETNEYRYYSMLHFFADGEFQTLKQYDYDSDLDGTADSTEMITGNVARVFYGHANSVDLLNDTSETVDYDTDETRLLVRKTHILSADDSLLSVYGQIPSVTDDGDVLDYSEFADSFGVTTYTAAATDYLNENGLEFNTMTLQQWITALDYLDGGSPDNADAFVAECMADDSRPFVDLTDEETLHLLMAQGVSSFAVQWAYTSDDLVDSSDLPLDSPVFTGVRWWPSVDPDGDEDLSDSDFTEMNGGDSFGVYLTLSGGTHESDWHDMQECETVVKSGATSTSYSFSSGFYPKALKFTFTLYDSNGLYEEGKTFTHIVYIAN